MASPSTHKLDQIVADLIELLYRRTGDHGNLGCVLVCKEDPVVVSTDARSANGSPAARVLAYATINQKPDINYLIAASATPMQDYSVNKL